MSKALQLKFLARLSLRLDEGRKEYDDTSFDRPIARTAAEIEEELIDVAGWVFVLWVQLRRRLAALEADVLEIEKRKT